MGHVNLQKVFQEQTANFSLALPLSFPAADSPLIQSGPFTMYHPDVEVVQHAMG